MTLHIQTITPNHLVYVSDRLINTPAGYLELADDRNKHLILLCDDAQVVASFAGIAGIPKGSDLKDSTIDWLTDVFQTTSQKAHGIDDHLYHLGRQVQPHIDGLKRQYKLDSNMLRLAIQISGWIGDIQFSCVIDNYLYQSCRAGPFRSTFIRRCRTYQKDEFGDGSCIFIIGREYLGDKFNEHVDKLSNVARHDDPKKIFQTSVSIIRAAAANSSGQVGYNCSGVRISRNDPHTEVYDDRDESVFNSVMPNIVVSTSRVSMSTRNMRGKQKKKEEKK